MDVDVDAEETRHADRTGHVCEHSADEGRGGPKPPLPSYLVVPFAVVAVSSSGDLTANLATWLGGAVGVHVGHAGAHRGDELPPFACSDTLRRRADHITRHDGPRDGSVLRTGRVALGSSAAQIGRDPTGHVTLAEVDVSD